MIRSCAIILSLAAPVGARDLQIGFPVACELGETCYIQHYVDRDPGPGRADFTCGALTNDGHKGTDIALPSLAAMNAGVDVLATAPGVVARIRDEMPDIRSNDPSAPNISGRECGNGLVIDHGGGWETQYCHLRQNSITVVPGRRVRMGEVLGQIGLSGWTEFPHVHVTLRKDGNVVDPFDTANQQSCGGMSEPLWLDPMPYQPGGFIAAGMATNVPDFEALKAGTPQAPVMRNTPMVVWGLMFGSRAGDLVDMTIMDPTGQVIHEGQATLDRPQAQLFRASGRRPPEGGWAPGTYRAEIKLIREGEIVDMRALSFPITP